MTQQNPEPAWVICCDPEIVLFGYATAEELKKETPTVKRVRMLIYWSAPTRGVHGAAAIGPQPGSRVTPSVPEQIIQTKIQASLRCTPEATKVWESEPWD